MPDAAPLLRFTAQGGTVVGTGSSVTDHVPPHCPERRMFAGRVSVAVRPDAGASSFRLMVSGEGLPRAWLVAKTRG